MWRCTTAAETIPDPLPYRGRMITSATFLFDGECGFCRASADVLRDRVAPRGVQVLPFQGADLGRYGVTAEQCRRAAALVGLDGGGAALPPLFGAAAIARALRRGDGVWAAAGTVMGAPGVRRVAATVYRWVADHRSSLPWPPT